MTDESRIVYETLHVYVYRLAEDRFSVRCHDGTHSVVVGEVTTLEQAERPADRLSRYPRQLHVYLNH